MAFSELYVCDGCGFDAVLVHAEEWAPGGTDEAPSPYRDGADSIGGLLNRMWCTVCRCVRPFPFLTLNPPGSHAVVAYAEAQRRGCDGREEGPCPVCRTQLIWQLHGAPCPRCSSGTMRFTGEWEDAI